MAYGNAGRLWVASPIERLHRLQQGLHELPEQLQQGLHELPELKRMASLIYLVDIGMNIKSYKFVIVF